MSAVRNDRAVALSRLVFDPRARLACSAAFGLFLVLILVGDALARQLGNENLFAPSEARLWVAVALGALYGIAGILWERVQLRLHRAKKLVFHRAPLGERLAWKHQRGNLLEAAFFLPLFLGIVVWCVSSGTFVLLPALAACAVFFGGNVRLAVTFKAQLEEREEAEASTTDRPHY